jgi:hypothetical protein
VNNGLNASELIVPLVKFNFLIGKFIMKERAKETHKRIANRNKQIKKD